MTSNNPTKREKGIPQKAQEHIDSLKYYEVDDSLETCDLLHLYDTGEFGAKDGDYSEGFVDSRMFDVWAFDFDTKRKCKLEGKDEISFRMKDCPIDIVRVFADGSTLIRFKRKMRIGWGQSLEFEEILNHHA